MRARRFMAAMLVAALGCGGSSSPTEPTPPPPPPITFISVSVSGASSLIERTSSQLVLSAKRSDNSGGTLDPSVALWSSSDQTVVTVWQGKVTAIQPGSAMITASFSGMSASLALTVKSVWDPWPWLSQESRDYIQQNMLPHGATMSWSKDTIKVWAQPEFSRQDLERAFAFWEEEVHQNRVSRTFVLVSDSASADVPVFRDPWIPEGYCGAGNPTQIFGSTINRAAVRVSPNCSFDWLFFAHELGHTLGMHHTPSGSDVMGFPTSTYHTSQLLSEVSLWNNSVPPGTNLWAASNLGSGG